jgi:hypothetical protein
MNEAQRPSSSEQPLGEAAADLQQSQFEHFSDLWEATEPEGDVYPDEVAWQKFAIESHEIPDEVEQAPVAYPKKDLGNVAINTKLTKRADQSDS